MAAASTCPRRYETRATDCAEAVACVRSGCDIIAVSSCEEIAALCAACRAAGVSLDGCDVVAHGPETAAGVSREGLAVAAVNADPSSFDGLADAVASVLARKR